MHAGLRANLSFFMPVAWGGPSPSTEIHSLGCLGSVSIIPFSSSVPGLFLKRSKLHPPPPLPSTHTHYFHVYTGITGKAL